MAKKEIVSSGKMSALMERMLKNSKLKNVELLRDSTILNEKPQAKTNVKMLNVALSGKMDGGLSSGITLIAGPSRHYKTTYGLHCIKGFQDLYEDNVILYYNNEFGAKKSYFENCGVDMSKIIHCPFENIEQLKFDLVNQLETLTEDDHVLVFIDSLANAASKKEVDSALNENSAADMTRAKEIKSLMRIITPKLYLRDIPLIAVAHVYSSMEFISKPVVGGGTSMYYNPDTIWIVGKAQIKDKDEVTGSTFTIRVEKSRYIREKSSIPIHVRWDTGISKYSGVADLAVEFGVVREGRDGKSTAYFYDTISGESISTKQNKNDMDEVFWNRVFSETDLQYKIEQKYCLPTPKALAEHVDVSSEED